MEAFSVVGHIAEDVTSLQFWVADIDNDELSRDVEAVRQAVIRAGNTLARLRFLEVSSAAAGGSVEPVPAAAGRTRL
jgi:hypothetical protein